MPNDSSHPTAARTAIRAVVIDDEPLARDELVFLLGECGGVEVLGTAAQPTDAIDLVERTQPDIAFVDLRMPGSDGVALAEALLRRAPACEVIIVSAHDDGAVRAYEANVLDYLLKPVRLERLQRSLERFHTTRAARFVTQAPPAASASQVMAMHAPAASATAAGNTTGTPRPARLAIPQRGSFQVLDPTTIAYFEVRDEFVWAVTDTERVCLDCTLSALENQLDPTTFFRCHRKFILNLNKVRAIEPSGHGTYNLILDHPDRPAIPLARERAREFRAFIPIAGQPKAAS